MSEFAVRFEEVASLAQSLDCEKGGVLWEKKDVDDKTHFSVSI